MPRTPMFKKKQVIHLTIPYVMSVGLTELVRQGYYRSVNEAIRCAIWLLLTSSEIPVPRVKRKPYVIELE